MVLTLIFTEFQSNINIKSNLCCVISSRIIIVKVNPYISFLSFFFSHHHYDVGIRNIRKVFVVIFRSYV